MNEMVTTNEYREADDLAAWRREIEARLPAQDGYATVGHGEGPVDPDWVWSTMLLRAVKTVRDTAPVGASDLLTKDVSQTALDQLYVWGLIDIDVRNGERLYLRVNGEKTGAIIGALEDGDGARAYELAAPAVRDWLQCAIRDERAAHAKVADALRADVTRTTALWRAEVTELQRQRQRLEDAIADLSAQIDVARAALAA